MFPAVAISSRQLHQKPFAATLHEIADGSPASRQEVPAEQRQFFHGLERLANAQEILDTIALHAALAPESALALQVVDAFRTDDYHSAHIATVFEQMDMANRKKYLRHVTPASAERLFTGASAHLHKSLESVSENTFAPTHKTLTAFNMLYHEAESRGISLPQKHSVPVNVPSSDYNAFLQDLFVHNLHDTLQLLVAESSFRNCITALVDDISPDTALQCLAAAPPAVLPGYFPSESHETLNKLFATVSHDIDAMTPQDRTAALCILNRRSFTEHIDSLVMQRVEHGLQTALEAGSSVEVAELCETELCRPRAFQRRISTRSLMALPPDMQISIMERVMLHSEGDPERILTALPGLEGVPLDAGAEARRSALKLVSAFQRKRAPVTTRNAAIAALAQRFAAAPVNERGAILVLTARALRRIISPSLIDFTLGSRAFSKTESALCAFVNREWQHADAAQQRHIALDMLPFVASSGFDQHALSAPWKAKIEATAAQPYHLEGRPTETNGFAFVRALRESMVTPDCESYAFQLTTALRALESADERSKYYAVSLFAADIPELNTENRAAYEAILLEHVERDPRMWAQSMLPRLLKLLPTTQLGIGQQRRVRELTAEHLVHEDRAAGIARVLMTTEPPPEERRTLEACFAQTMGTLLADKRTPLERGVTESRLRGLLMHRIGDESVAVQAASAPLLLPMATRADLMQALDGAHVPEFGRPHFWNLCVAHYATLPAERQAQVAARCVDAIETIPRHLFAPLHDQIDGVFPYENAIRVIGAISDFRDERLPYIIDKVIHAPASPQDAGRADLAVLLVQERDAKVPAAVTERIWAYLGSCPMRFDRPESAALFAQTFAEQFHKLPVRVQVALSDRALVWLESTYDSSSELPHVPAFLDHLITRITVLDPQRQKDLLKLAIPLCRQLSPQSNYVIMKCVFGALGEAELRRDYLPSVVPMLAREQGPERSDSSYVQAKAAVSRCIRFANEANAGLLHRPLTASGSAEITRYLMTVMAHKTGEEIAVIETHGNDMLKAELFTSMATVLSHSGNKVEEYASTITDPALREIVTVEVAAKRHDPAAMDELADRFAARGAAEEAAHWRHLATVTRSNTGEAAALALPPRPVPVELAQAVAAEPPALEVSAHTHTALAFRKTAEDAQAPLNIAVYMQHLEAAFAQRDYAGTRLLAAVFRDVDAYRDEKHAAYLERQAAVMARNDAAIELVGDTPPIEARHAAFVLYKMQERQYLDRRLMT